MQGMFSRIEENIRNKFISIEHLGVIIDGEKISGPDASSWKVRMKITLWNKRMVIPGRVLTLTMSKKWKNTCRLPGLMH